MRCNPTEPRRESVFRASDAACPLPPPVVLGTFLDWSPAVAAADRRDVEAQTAGAAGFHAFTHAVALESRKSISNNGFVAVSGGILDEIVLIWRADPRFCSSLELRIVHKYDKHYAHCNCVCRNMAEGATASTRIEHGSTAVVVHKLVFNPCLIRGWFGLRAFAMRMAFCRSDREARL